MTVPEGWKLVPVNPTPEMVAAAEKQWMCGSNVDMAKREWAAMLAAAPAAPQAEPCIGNDPICPCQDGDACHYKDSADGTKAWPVPQSEPKRDPLHGLAPTHRCPACGAFWRQCDDASWNLRSASCCGLCDAGRVELVCWLDEPKREPLSDERIDLALQTDPATLLALMGGEMTVGEFKSALRRLARTVERAHGIGGSDE